MWRKTNDWQGSRWADDADAWGGDPKARVLQERWTSNRAREGDLVPLGWLSQETKVCSLIVEQLAASLVINLKLCPIALANFQFGSCQLPDLSTAEADDQIKLEFTFATGMSSTPRLDFSRSVAR